MTDKTLKTTDIDDSQVGVAGDRAKIFGGIHFYASNLGFISILVLALVSLFSFSIVLLFINSNPDTRPKSFVEALFAVAFAAFVCIVFIRVLTKAFKSLNSFIILFLILPLCSFTASLKAASYIMDKPIYNIVEHFVSEGFDKDDKNLTLDGSGKKLDTTYYSDQSLSNIEQPANVPKDDDSDVIPSSGQDIPGENDFVRTVLEQLRDNIFQEENLGKIKDYQPVIVSNSGKVFKNNIGMEFVYLTPGRFLMGSPEDEAGRYSLEKQHWVELTKGFYLQTAEVTQGQWKAVMGGYPPDLYFKDCGDDCPVEMVSWNDVQEFIQVLNMTGSYTYRLPTEAEWEYAARSGTTTPFAFGNCLSTNQANYDGNYPLKDCDKGIYRKKPMPVASFEANAWGLYDMHGNVWEWCQDWYDFDYYSKSPAENPIGPKDDSRRVVRGGSWNGRAQGCRSACRRGLEPVARCFDLGFRLVSLPGQQVKHQEQDR